MKRDFSEIIHNEIIGAMRDKSYLYTSDISSVDLFKCKNIDTTELSVYSADVDDVVSKTNTYVRNTNSDIDDLMVKVDDFFFTAKDCDAECKTIVENDVSYTVEGYMDDLKIFVDALGASDKDGNLKDLPVFSDSGFGEDIRTDLNERLYNDLVTEDGINYGLVEHMMQADSLTRRELEVLTEMVNNEYINPDGTVNCEELEKFLELCYTSEVVQDGCCLEDAKFTATGAYNVFAEYYNIYVNLMVRAEGDLFHPDGEITTEQYMGMTSMNGIILGVNHFYNTVYGDVYVFDEETSGWDPNTIDLEITDPEGANYYEISCNGHEMEDICVFDYDSITESSNDSETENAFDDYNNPTEVYINSINSNIADYCYAQVEGAITGDFLQHIPGSGLIETGMEIISWDSEAQQAYAEQQSINEGIIETEQLNNYENLCANISGFDTSGSGTYIGYGDQGMITNQTAYCPDLEASIAFYNQQEGEDLTVDEVLDAYYNFSEEKWENVQGYVNYHPDQEAYDAFEDEFEGKY